MIERITAIWDLLVEWTAPMFLARPAPPETLAAFREHSARREHARRR
jgi:hypothetical protein